MKHTISIAIVGRSNSGKSTFVSTMIANEYLGTLLYKDNTQGKTKLNTQYYLYNDCESTTFEIILNDDVLDFYLVYFNNSQDKNFSIDIDTTIDIDATKKKIIKDFSPLLVDIKNINNCEDIDSLSEVLNKIIDDNYNNWLNLELKDIIEISEKYPTFRNLVKLLLVKTKASTIVQELIINYDLDYISIVDTKGFGDKTDLIEYEFPKVDISIFMVAEKLVDSDYIFMESAISDQINKIPTILCARGQKLRINEVEALFSSNKILEDFIYDYEDGFITDDTPATILKNNLIEKNIINVSDNNKSFTELFLTEKDIFRTVPYILKANERSGKNIVTEIYSNQSKKIYAILVKDILNSAINAKIKEEQSLQDLQNKLYNSNTNQQIKDSILPATHDYIVESSTSPILEDRKIQNEYFNTYVINKETFMSNIYNPIRGPRGGTTNSPYEYNYKRLARGSYVCLEKYFCDFQTNTNQHLTPKQIELLIRKVRRDICRYGGLFGYEDSYSSYIDYDKLITGYDEEKTLWEGSFRNLYYYPIIEQNLNKYNFDATYFKAPSVYYGVIRNVINNAINEVLGISDKDILELAKL